MRARIAILAALVVALAVPAIAVASDFHPAGKIKEHYNAKARATYFSKHADRVLDRYGHGQIRTADHTWLDYENFAYEYGTNVHVDGLGYCNEAILRSVWAVNDSLEIYRDHATYDSGGSCPAGGENFSQKWTGVIDDGLIWGDCAYDEDPYPPTPISADEWSVDCAFFDTFRNIGGYERSWTSQPQSGSTSISCAEAQFTAVGNINNAALYPNAGQTTAFATCSGPHPNGSAKYVQLYSNNGAQFFDVLVDRDPSCVGCGTYSTTLYVMEENLHRQYRNTSFSIYPVNNP